MKSRLNRKSNVKYIIILFAIFGVLAVVLIARYYSGRTQPITAVERHNLDVQLVDHELLIQKGSFYTKREGTRIDLLQRDKEGHNTMVVKGNGDEFDIEDFIESEFGKHIHRENDHTKLITSPDNRYALFLREKPGLNEVFAVDTVQNQVYRITDTNVADPLSAVMRGDRKGTGWVDNYFVFLADSYYQTQQYGAVKLLSLDIKNKQLYHLDKSISAETSPFLKEVWELKVCGKKVVYSKGWDIGYKQPRRDNPDRHGYLIATGPNGDNRRIIKKVGYLSGMPKTTCSY